MTKPQPGSQVIDSRAIKINTGNLLQRLYRIRSELAQMVQQVDDALGRIEQEKRS